MESFHIQKSSDVRSSQTYIFSPEDLADIPHPDDISGKAQRSSEDKIELPLPPGTSGDDFTIPFQFKQQPKYTSDNLSNFSKSEGFGNSSNLDHAVSETFNILPLDEQCKQKQEQGTDEFASKPMDIVDDSKYSPSKIDSDEDNLDFVTAKPKVLGKEQAKKRLLAFSLSKQPGTSVKKQSKVVTPAKNKEKPPNPNKGSNVQEQFRATISEIEEEKKKMFQNMPNYLLQEMSDLTKTSHSLSSPSLQLLEKLKSEHLDTKNKDSSSRDTSMKSYESRSRRRSQRSRSLSSSRNKNKKRRRSRSKRRSRSNTKRSRSRRRSHSRSKRSRSHSKRSREEKNYKSETKISRESQSLPRKKLPENWSSYKAAGFSVKSDSKNQFDEIKSRREDRSRRSRSPSTRVELKPIFNYLNKGCHIMTSLQARPADPTSTTPVLFVEKTVKFTRIKPMLSWAENPKHATDFFMSKQMLLENCDPAVASILHSLMENKNNHLEKQNEEPLMKSRPWYPREDYLIMDTCHDKEPTVLHSLEESCEITVEKEPLESVENRKDVNMKEDAKKRETSSEKKISLVNDSYLSDEDDQVKEVIMGEVKVQLDLDTNSVKVRSKWDSDYEGENSEKESVHRRVENKNATDLKTKVEEPSSRSKDKITQDFDFDLSHEKAPTEKKKSALTNLSDSNAAMKSPTSKPGDVKTGNLVSEYEEFLKMVSANSGDVPENPKPSPQINSKLEKHKIKKAGKLVDETLRSPKFNTTDWDKESDHEEESSGKKIQFCNPDSTDEFLISKGEKLDVKKDGKKRKKLQKKKEKSKETKAKNKKKTNKAKKKKYTDSCSEDSSSDSYDSDSSHSDSSGSDSSVKKKKKKFLGKTKKKQKKESSSEMNSDLDSNKGKKKKSKQKGGKKKEVSSDSDEVQTTLLKQLDFKKQLIIKKIEEIDSISDKGLKKKKKESQIKRKESDSSDGTDSEKYLKLGKQKKTEVKVEKNKKKSKIGIKKSKFLGKMKKLKNSTSSSESDSESDVTTSEDSVKGKKFKKTGKSKRDSSEDIDSDEKEKKSSRSNASNKSNKKYEKARRDSSSSESNSDDGSEKKTNGKQKKDEGANDHEKLTETNESCLKENLLSDQSDIKYEKALVWERQKLWKKLEEQRKKKKEDDDWEASSSVDESERECKTRESSWDDEIAPREAKIQISKDDLSKVETNNKSNAQKAEVNESSQNPSDLILQLSSGTLKSSLSVFSFNENSFCSFGQELSRDFFLTEVNYSNSGNLNGNEHLKIHSIEPRPFQSVSKDAEMKKVENLDLYSPGHSDSELSDVELNKSEKASKTKDEMYDPLNCDSEGSVENNKIELSSIPLPSVPDILLPGETRNYESMDLVSSSESSSLKDLTRNESGKLDIKLPPMTPPLKSNFTSTDFALITTSNSPFNSDVSTPPKRQLMSVKGQPKLKSKAASVFQDESDEDNSESLGKGKTIEGTLCESSESSKERTLGESKSKGSDNWIEEKSKGDVCKKNDTRSKSRERSLERSGKKRRSRSRERKASSKNHSKKMSSPSQQKNIVTLELAREKREIRSDSFEIEPLKSCIDPNELTNLVQPIPVLTGLESSADDFWSRSLIPRCEFPHASDNLIDNAESFDIYPSEESPHRNKSYTKDYPDYDKVSFEKSKEQRSRKERRKSRSKSLSPKNKRRSKSPEKRRSPRNRSPKRKSLSPKRREKSPFSPRRRSPKRKSPTRKYKSSRSPDKRRKSRSRSPRKRRSSPSKRSRSVSPRKYRSPKRQDESPRIRDPLATVFSPRERFSPRKDTAYSNSYSSTLQNRIPVIGCSMDDANKELNSSEIRSPKFESSIAFPRHMADPSVHEPDMYNSFYEGEYAGEFGMPTYPEEVSVNNLITVKNHDLDKTASLERLTLDQRIELELGVPMAASSQAQSDQYQACPQFQDTNYFQTSCNCDSASVGTDNFYPNQSVHISDFNGQYFNGHQHQSSYRSFQQYPNSQPVQNSVLQVGNIVEVVPAPQHAPPSLSSLTSNAASQIMQVGNVLQVVPSQKSVPTLASQNYSNESPIVKTQKATAVVAPSSVVPTPNPEAILSPLIKAIQLEREKKRKEKEKRKAEREARRKARQLRREAKLMLVNEKLKKSVQNEGLMLGQEVEDDELLDGLDVPSPPIPVEIITVSSPNALPPAGKGILITAGFMPKPPSEKKEVKFADGVCPGEGTSTSGGEDIASPPPKPKLPKEKRFKKRKTKVKKKVKVQIIRQIIQEEEEDEDDLSPPPPPPGDPPPVFFARFPFAGEAQFPVYQTQTTTTTLTTVQYPNQSFE